MKTHKANCVPHIRKNFKRKCRADKTLGFRNQPVRSSLLLALRIDMDRERICAFFAIRILNQNASANFPRAFRLCLVGNSRLVRKRDRAIVKMPYRFENSRPQIDRREYGGKRFSLRHSVQIQMSSIKIPVENDRASIKFLISLVQERWEDLYVKQTVVVYYWFCVIYKHCLFIIIDRYL